MSPLVEFLLREEKPLPTSSVRVELRPWTQCETLVEQVPQRTFHPGRFSGSASLVLTRGEWISAAVGPAWGAAAPPFNSWKPSSSLVHFLVIAAVSTRSLCSKKTKPQTNTGTLISGRAHAWDSALRHVIKGEDGNVWKCVSPPSTSDQAVI